MKNPFKVTTLAIAVFSLAMAFLYGQPTGSEGYKKQIKVQLLLASSTTVAGQPIVYPKTDKPEVRAVLVEIPPGAETGWHKHPFPCYAYILSGSLSVELEDGTVHNLTAGQALAETVNIAHNGKNTGSEPVKLVMFVTGETGNPFTVPAPIPKK